MAESSNSSAPSGSSISSTSRGSGESESSSNDEAPSCVSLLRTWDSTYSWTAPAPGRSSSGDQSLIPRGCPSIAMQTSIASSSPISSGSRALAIDGSRPSNLIDSKPDIPVNGFGALVTTSTAAEVPEHASSISWMEFECLPLDCWASSRTKSVFFESALADIASFDDGVLPPNHIPAIEDGSESAWQVAHLTSHPSSRRDSAIEAATVVLPIPGSPSSRMLEPSERLDDTAATKSSLPCRSIWSGMGPTDLPLRLFSGGVLLAASSLPVSVAWYTFLLRGAPITWAVLEITNPCSSSEFSGGCSADLTTPRCSARPARDISLGTSHDSSRSLPKPDR